MNKLLFLTIFIFCIMLTFRSSFAQESELYQLELKSGISVKCHLISITDDIIYAISEDGKKFSVSMDEVASFVKIEEVHLKKKEESALVPLQPMTLKENVVTTTIKGGPAVYIEKQAFVFASITGILNYEIKHWSLGAGFSLEGIIYYFYFPVFADIKYNFDPGKSTTTFLFTDLGYAFSSYSGIGFILTAGAGVKHQLTKDMNLIYDAGFKTQFLKNNYYNSSAINYLMFNIGVQF